MTYLKRILVITLLVVGITTIISSMAIAQGRIQLRSLNVRENDGLRFGRLTVEPSIGYGMEYHSNIFREPEGESDEVIHQVLPSVHLSYLLGYNQMVEAGIAGTLAAYSQYTENNYEIITPYIAYKRERSSGFYLTARDEFTYSSDPFRTEEIYREGEQVSRWENDLDLLLGYRLAGKWFAEAAYRNLLSRYNSDIDKWRNEINHQYGLSLFYQLTGKTAVFGQLRQTRAIYDKQNDGHGIWSSATSRDSFRTTGFAGIRFDEGGRLSGEVKLGYAFKDYDNHRDPYGREYKKNDSWAAESSVDYQFRPRTRLTVLLNRSIEGAPDADSASFIHTSMGLRIAQRFGNRIYGGIGGSWGRYDYSDERDDLPQKTIDVYQVQADVQWRFTKWLFGGVQYALASKQANHHRYRLEEYDDHVITMTLTLKL
jgi:hypothetical protein